MIIAGAGGFGEGMAMDLPSSQRVQSERDRVPVARLRLPAQPRFNSLKPQSTVPVMLGRTSLTRLQQALAV